MPEPDLSSLPASLAKSLPDLPVASILPALCRALDEAGRAVLAAPPGAGKTTLVPLALLEASWRSAGRLVIVEPRRLAARAAARRMASMLGEAVGETVGYRVRLDSRVSEKTVIEVVTPGVFTRMALDDPELGTVAAVVFDEFHERGLETDFGLALAIDIRAGLREDLRIVVMSATLDTAKVAALLDGAPVVESSGRAFPVEIRHRDRPPREPIDATMARAVTEVHASETGSILAFLPGQAEIRRTIARLEGRFGDDTRVVALYGGLDGAEQDAAIRPPVPGTRKIVLATAIAETSITIDGVRIVVDGGLSRQPVFEPATGITRLETVPVSRAAADQRAGRAGRTEPGIALRLWREQQTAALPSFAPPEMLAADLSGLVLDCAAWGVGDPRELSFIDPPPERALDQARGLLETLGAFHPIGGLSQRGRTMRRLGLPVRDAAMIVAAAEAGSGTKKAARLAVLLGEPALGGTAIDLDERLRRFAADRTPRAVAARKLAGRLARQARDAHGGPEGETETNAPTVGTLLLPGYADRLAIARGGRGRFRMATGRGAAVDEAQAIAGAQFLVVADCTGRAREHRVLAAAVLTRPEVEAGLDGRIETVDECTFDARARAVRARRIRRFDAIVLQEEPRARPDPQAVTSALCEGVRLLGVDALPFGKAGRQLRERLGFLHRILGAPWPDVSDTALVERLDEWFAPFQPGVDRFDAIAPGSLGEGLRSLVPPERLHTLGHLAPTHFTTPLGTRHPIRYDGEEPVLPVRVQELFGLCEHPSIAGDRFPLVLELLSPAHRPLQTTRDLPGFWAGSWKDVRADMRGRYPKHPWPEDPLQAAPTNRTRSRER
ncbi:ATP-dependent helicase HrpB [Pararhizobium mangrovi]|uniref:ATP-dependent helicase HrpB n=1 Tax=Pararhizobium mangrovi TaxID=2590452 RepID=A0A506U5M0_9HYPH|nr:ATP-dependent helicase HrpB [Pararhizobium mangrovi]TPW28394.1 ATP-dependent helicase HrpB [Pararhizobium mangrovi]